MTVPFESPLAHQDWFYRRGAYDQGYPANRLWFGETDLLARTLLSLPTFDSILELGCGPGIWTRRLASIARRVTAVDASPAMLDACRETTRGLSNITFVPEAPAGSFDLIFAALPVSRGIPLPSNPNGKVFVYDLLPMTAGLPLPSTEFRRFLWYAFG